MNIKKVKVLFSYTESIVPPRCRKARDQRFHDGEMVVDVREVSPEEAPVALIQTNHDFGGKPLGTAEYRWFEDQLWVNQRVEFRFGESNDKPLGDFIDARDDGANRIHGAGRHATKREVIERFQSEASSYVLIQGERWEPAGEPRYYVDDSSTYGTYVKVAHSFQRHSQRERYFSLKQYADAKALADRMNRERERPEVDATPRSRCSGFAMQRSRVTKSGPSIICWKFGFACRKMSSNPETIWRSLPDACTNCTIASPRLSSMSTRQPVA
jgi:hypothetical protein